MFISYEYIKYLGYNIKTNVHSWQYRIIDSDFEEVVVEVAVIHTYEKRNLPVAPNLMKAILYINKKWKIHICTDCYQYIREFMDHMHTADEIKKRKNK